MSAVIAFLKPTKIKLVFLVEWILFVLIIAAGGELESNQVLVAGFPLIFFYFVACVMAALSKHRQRVAQSWGLFTCAVGLIVLDQAIKTGVTALVPHQTSIPIINNWLYLAHEYNFHGSWVAVTFNVQSVSVFNLIQWGLVIPVLLFSILCRRYYVAKYRQSLWVDVAFLGIFSGVASWACDMSLRGHIVDFIHLPGLVTADLKDVFMTIGVAALFAEALDNPQISWRWLGIRKESDALIQMLEDLWSFSFQELDKIHRVVMRKFR
jgi:lipoprotein signal peptidase